LGNPSKKSLCAPSEKLATRNQLVALCPASSFGPALTPSAYLINSRPVDVGVASGVSARRPINCMRASWFGVVVEKDRRGARGMREASRVVVNMLGKVYLCSTSQGRGFERS